MSQQRGEEEEDEEQEEYLSTSDDDYNDGSITASRPISMNRKQKLFAIPQLPVSDKRKQVSTTFKTPARHTVPSAPVYIDANLNAMASGAAAAAAADTLSKSRQQLHSAAATINGGSAKSGTLKHAEDDTASLIKSSGLLWESPHYDFARTVHMLTGLPMQQIVDYRYVHTLFEPINAQTDNQDMANIKAWIKEDLRDPTAARINNFVLPLSARRVFSEHLTTVIEETFRQIRHLAKTKNIDAFNSRSYDDLIMNPAYRHDFARATAHKVVAHQLINQLQPQHNGYQQKRLYALASVEYKLQARMRAQQEALTRILKTASENLVKAGGYLSRTDKIRVLNTGSLVSPLLIDPANLNSDEVFCPVNDFSYAY